MAPNITYTTTYYNSTFTIQESLQQHYQGGCGFPFLGFSNTLDLGELPYEVKVTPSCCICHSLTSTTHCVARGSGQDQKLWGGGKDRRTATGQRNHFKTNLSLFSSLEAVRYVLVLRQAQDDSVYNHATIENLLCHTELVSVNATIEPKCHPELVSGPFQRLKALNL